MTNDIIITEQSETDVLEVTLTDIRSTEHIYWVALADCPEADDTTDWAITKAKAHHAQLRRPPIPDDEFTDTDEIQSYAWASEPFSRGPGEYTMVT